MPYDALMARISEAHGPTTFHENCQGRAIHTRCTSSRTRQRRFSIYSFASYGSRSGQPPQNLGATIWRLALDVPGQDGQPLNLNFRNMTTLAPLRTPPEHVSFKQIKDRLGNHILLQVTDSALYLLFNIAEVDEPETILQYIYEYYVLDLAENRHRDLIHAFREQPAAGQTPVQIQEVETRTVMGGFNRPARPRPVEAEGEGKTWKWFAGKGNYPIVPLESRPMEVVNALAIAKNKGLKDQLTRAQNEFQRSEQTYSESLRLLAAARRKLEDDRGLVDALTVAVSKGMQTPDEMTVTLLQGVLDSYYEKVWSTNDFYWALTRPVTMQYAPNHNGEQDPCKVLAGKFLVRVSKECQVKFFREDGRIVSEPSEDVTGNQGGRGWSISPHNRVTMDTSEGSICWGTQGMALNKAQEEFDFAQLFLLAAQHIAYVNPEESYVSLRGYAKYLQLPMIEDPLIASFEELARIEEEKKQQAAEEQRKKEEEEKKKQEAEEKRKATMKINELGDLTEEEMVAMGINMQLLRQGNEEDTPVNGAEDEMNAGFIEMEGH